MTSLSLLAPQSGAIRTGGLQNVTQLGPQPTAWCEFSGVYHIAYTNGHRITYTIGADGGVTVPGAAGVGQLKGWYGPDCPGVPCARLGKYEYISVKGDTLSLKHYA